MTKDEIAVENFKSGCNCSQAVAAAFCEDFGIDKCDCMRISEGFGGGMGRMRSVCGAVSGMFMIAGLKLSSGDAKDMETRQLLYQTVQDMAADFKAEFGTIICADLLEGTVTTSGSTPTPRDAEFYKKRPCAEYVRFAAEIVQKHLYD